VVLAILSARLARQTQGEQVEAMLVLLLVEQVDRV
jgi:hypothetical protein